MACGGILYVAALRDSEMRSGRILGVVYLTRLTVDVRVECSLLSVLGVAVCKIAIFMLSILLFYLRAKARELAI